MALSLRDADRHTYGDYLGWGEDARYELIDGLAYALAPAPTRMHQELVLQIGRQLADVLEGTRQRRPRSVWATRLRYRPGTLRRILQRPAPTPGWLLPLRLHMTCPVLYLQATVR
jgi:hypothetical protein